MLWWGIFAAAPIVIHLWNRRRHHEVTWAAMEFLLGAIRKRARRIRIEQLLLLTVRVVILGAFAMALADPVFSVVSSLSDGANSEVKTHVVLVIDGSYSMTYAPSEQSRFAVAQQRAQELVDESPRGDGFTLLLMTDRPRVIIHEPAYDSNDVKLEIANLQPTHGGARLSETLNHVRELLEAVPNSSPLTATKICFFTDLGSNTWSATNSDSVKRQVKQLADRATLVLLDVGQAGANNLAITSLQTDRQIAIRRAPLQFSAEVRNFGRSRVTRQITWLIDGRRVSETPVVLDAGATQTVSLSHPFEDAGEHSVEVRATPDALPVDDRRWQSIPVLEALRVLCISGAPGAAKFVAPALEPRTDDEREVDVEIATETAILERSLIDYDCVFLCNVGRLATDEAKVMTTFVQNGGGLTIILGEQVHIDSYNRELAGEQRLLPAPLERVVRGEAFFLDGGRFRHPIATRFRNLPGSELLTLPSYRYVKLRGQLAERATPVFRFSGTGDAALTAEKIRHGHCLVLTTAASTNSLDRSENPPLPWSTLPKARDFVSLVQEMLRYLVQGRNNNLNLEVGQPLTGTVNSGAQATLTLVTPDGTRERIWARDDGTRLQWTFPATDRSGLYQLESDAAANNTPYYAVNVNAADESQLLRLNRNELPTEFGDDYHIADESAPRLALPRRRSYFRYCLTLVLVLLLVETYLGWRFGRASP